MLNQIFYVMANNGKLVPAIFMNSPNGSGFIVDINNIIR